MILFLYLLVSVLLIIILTSKFNINPVISLLFASLFLGLILQIEFINIINLLAQGIWKSISGIGLIILFSCFIGQFLKESNSINNFGNLIIKNLKKNSLLSLNFLGLFVGSVVFCDSAFLILNGISKSLASSSSLPLNSLNLSLAGGLYSSHTLIPPTPGPIAAINNFNLLDNIGTVMILGVLVSIPSSLISFFFAKKIIGNNEKLKLYTKNLNKLDKPHILAYMSIIIPLLLIGLNTLTNIVHINQFYFLTRIIKYLGNPVVALLIGLIFSSLIPRKNRNINQIFKNSLNDFTPIILLTSMGSAFGNIIKNSELINLLPSLINENNNNVIYICIIGFLCSTIIKTAQGSSTSSIIIISAIIFPMIQDFNYSSFQLSMIILSIGAGSMMISHINDSYFWIVIKKSQLDLVNGLKYFSVMTIFQSLGTLLFIILTLLIFI